MRRTFIGVVTSCLVLGLLATVGQTQPQDQVIPDNAITLAVDQHLQTDDGVPAHLIDVRTEESIVMLSGSVDNLLAKNRARQIAASVKGVRAVVNKIDVSPLHRPDAALLDAVKAALRQDAATDAYEIDITVVNGVVTLTGTVESWQEKQLSAQVVKGITGVRAVNNRIEITPLEARYDHEIKADVRSRLAMDVWVDSALITVEVDDGAVTLRGTVGSAAEKDRAITDAWVAGVTAVDASDLEVRWWARDDMQRQQPTPIKSDAAVATAIEDAWLYDPRVVSFAPEVQVEDGVATLTGVVDNLAAKLAAAEDARNTIGVWRVKNHIRVRPPQTPVDATIVDAVRTAIHRDAILERHEISVAVRNGKAYLTGIVDSTFERRRAADVVARVPGVIDVSNGLTVRQSWSAKSDWEIKQDIDQELWWSPFVDSDQVTVSVQDGVATLTGTVDSWLEHGAAISNANEGGAKRVRDYLRVRTGPDYYRPDQSG